MPEAAEWTIGKLLDWTKGYLAQQGSDSPRLDAEVLLAHARKCQRIELYTAFDEVATDEVREAFRSLVKRRAAGAPVAYLVESKEFYSLPFFVNSSVLIPRPETEFLVIRLLDLAKEHPRKDGLRIADIGTGSGILAICAAIYLPASQIVAIDRSDEALAVARKNAETHGVSDRIEFRQEDLMSGVENARFDFVISNPPYVSNTEFEKLDLQVKDHEPKQALVAGAHGTEVVARLVPQAAQCLVDGGWLVMEISPMIHQAVCTIIDSSEGLGSVHTTNDLAKLPRVVETQKLDRDST